MDGLKDWLRTEKTRMECRHASNAGRGRRNWLEGYIAALAAVEAALDGGGEDLPAAMDKVRELVKRYPELKESLDE
jgi:hypothetical protein